MTRLSGLLVAATLALAGCASTPTIEVTRFHLGQPTPSDAVAVVPAPGVDGTGLEFRSHAMAVERDLQGAGFRTIGGDGRSAYVCTLRAEQTTRAAGQRSSGMSIGLGGSTGGRNSSFGGGVTVPVGGSGATMVRVNQLALQIKRRSDNSVIWEGRAVQEIASSAAGSNLTAAVPVLSRALFSGFPGPSGQTVRVRAN